MPGVLDDSFAAFERFNIFALVWIVLWGGGLTVVLARHSSITRVWIASIGRTVFFEGRSTCTSHKDFNFRLYSSWICCLKDCTVEPYNSHHWGMAFWPL